MAATKNINIRTSPQRKQALQASRLIRAKGARGISVAQARRHQR